MKLNFWLLCGTMLSFNLLAQQVTNTPPAAPLETPAAAPMATNTSSNPAGTNAPAAKAGKKKTAAKKRATAKKKNPAAELKTVPLVAGPAVVEANHVNVRGQAKLKSEVVGRLAKGQQVTVLQEITRNNSGPEEPSAWAKIILPAEIHVWVNTAFIDATNKAVLPRRLNLRAGAGENYSVLGRLERGAPIKDISTKGEWTEIEAPTNAYAFVAAQYLKQLAPGELPATTTLAESPGVTNAAPVVPMPPATTVAEAPAVVPATTDTPAVPPAAEPAAVTNAPTETAATATSTNEPAPAVADEPPPKRIVDREGIVRGTFSIQAPTHFELYSPDTGHTIDYLYSASPNLDLRRYKGLRIVVTGEEALEERWGNTPVITIQKIQVLE
ncbi:MAG TPA: SH3 domain-containing protein [Candidatus Acidoferrum sp.]|jgi:uncharacterized protein YgiM (DUF1202 family)|nr:SH3 domain-containing protein [Candidatus Acidoferrum sp.]